MLDKILLFVLVLLLPVRIVIATQFNGDKNDGMSSDQAEVEAALNRMEEYKITSLVVTNSNKEVIGVLHMHDLLQAKII